MIPIQVRILLIIGSTAALWYVLQGLKKIFFSDRDRKFWITFTAALTLLSVFPETAFFLRKILHIISTSNLVYLVIIAILILQVFHMDIQVSQLNTEFKNLVQKKAIDNYENKKSEKH